MAFGDLRQFLSSLEKLGDLVSVEKEVNCCHATCWVCIQGSARART